MFVHENVVKQETLSNCFNAIKVQSFTLSILTMFDSQTGVCVCFCKIELKQVFQIKKANIKRKAKVKFVSLYKKYQFVLQDISYLNSTKMHFVVSHVCSGPC